MIKTYTLQDLEKMLKVSERTLFRYLDKGWLKGSLRGKWRFTDDDIRKFLNAGKKRKRSK